MAKPAATTGAAAAPEKKGKKKQFKKKERKHVPFGIVHIQASFNNTIVTISDPRGTCSPGRVPVRWAFADRAKVRPSPPSRPR